MVNKVVSIPAQTRAYKVAYKSGFHCHTVERLTDSIKTIILSVYESFKARFIVYKTVSKYSLQKVVYIQIYKICGEHMYIYTGYPGWPLHALFKTNLYFLFQVKKVGTPRAQ